jgi:hypothetical protein
MYSVSLLLAAQERCIIVVGPGRACGLPAAPFRMSRILSVVKPPVGTCLPGPRCLPRPYILHGPCAPLQQQIGGRLAALTIVPVLDCCTDTGTWQLHGSTEAVSDA